MTMARGESGDDPFQHGLGFYSRLPEEEGSASSVLRSTCHFILSLRGPPTSIPESNNRDIKIYFFNKSSDLSQPGIFLPERN
jgi:hypothetical protein